MPRFEYEIVYPVGGLKIEKANTIRELSEKSGYSTDVIYNKLTKNCKKTNIISVSRIMTNKSIETEKKKEKEIVNKIIKKTNKKYHYSIGTNDNKISYTKLKDGANALKIHTSFMFKILNSAKLRNEYKVELINDAL